MTPRNTTIGILVTLAMAAAAFAAGPPPRGPIPFATFDRNGDGSITPDEFDAVHAQRMQTRAAQGMPMRGAATAPDFSFFDRNGDGRLSPEELAAGQQQRRAMRMGGTGPGKGGGMGRNMPRFADFDTNGDGRLEEQEFYEARNKRIGERAKQGYQMRNLGKAPSFQDIDTNGDGIVTPEEFEAHQARHRQKMMQGR